MPADERARSVGSQVGTVHNVEGQLRALSMGGEEADRVRGQIMKGVVVTPNGRTAMVEEKEMTSETAAKFLFDEISRSH